MTTRRSIYLYPDDLERLKVLKRTYGLGTSAACRAGLALLLAHLQDEDEEAKRHALDTTVGDVRREKKMYEMYEGDDRNKQVNFLRNLAANIAFGSDDITVSAKDRVDYYCDVYAEDLPSWLDDHDRQLLIEFVGDD